MSDELMPASVCTIEGCDRPIKVKLRRLCDRHYTQWRKHGDPTVNLRPDLGLTFTDRFWKKVDKSGPVPSARPDLGPCWVWTAGLNDGYGQFIVMGQQRGKPVRAHRVAYELLLGRIPGGLDLDHLCRNRACVRPSHLEPVTNEENIRRGNWPSAVNARKTHCIRGHEFSPENTYTEPSGGRQCRTCIRIRSARRYQASV